MTDSNNPRRKKSIDFKIRFQINEDTPEGTILSYLNSMGSRSSKDLILQFLRMCLLPLAYKEKGDLSDEQLKVIALEACDALENRASYIRQVFFLEKPTQQAQSVIMMNGQNYGQPQSQPEPLPAPEPEPYKGIQVKGIGTQEDIDAVFGDM